MKTMITVCACALLATGCTSQSHTSATNYTQAPMSIDKFAAYNHSNYFHGKSVTIKGAKMQCISGNPLHKAHEGHTSFISSASTGDCIIEVPFKLHDEFAAAMRADKAISFEGVGGEIKNSDYTFETICVTRILPE